MPGISKIEKDEDFKSNILFLKNLGFKLYFSCDFVDDFDCFPTNPIKINRKIPQIEEL